MDNRLQNIAENWERAYDAFQQVNFKAWDFDSIKQSMLDYMKLYYPEDFNDYIESSDLVAIIELFSYLGELLAYRIDLNTHENFLATAERKESVLRLAKFLSYNASRNIPARGLVKVTSVSTTEPIVDSKGNNIGNQTIIWNDPNNDNWKEQFLLAMQQVLAQNFGTVLPSDRVQVQSVLFELYGLINEPVQGETLGYSVSVNGETYPMELVSAELNEFGPIEKRPERNQQINILYLNDGLGDSSDNTGFFFFTKQGTLERETEFFDGVLPNQTKTLSATGINNTDLWLNNIDDETNEVISGGERYNEPRVGEWQEVDVANAQNILYNTSPNRNKYEVETLADDGVRLLFGDGNFSSIPAGKFDIWYRTSTSPDEGLVIPRSSVQNKSSNFRYRDETGAIRTLSFSFSLVAPIQNAAPSETAERIREVAPSVYYTQDRMVNGRDYNEFLLQDNTILKLRSINRTFAGDSKYIGWHDPKEYYENVKLFGDDMALYFNTEIKNFTVTSDNLPPRDGGINIPLINALLENHVEPILRRQDFYNSMILKGTQPSFYRFEFSPSEITDLLSSINSLITSAPNTLYLTYRIQTDQDDNFWELSLIEPEDTGWDIAITSQTDNDWIINFVTRELYAHSPEIRFNVTNNMERVLTYDTLNSNMDNIVILKANVGVDGCSIETNRNFVISNGVSFQEGIYKGICDFHTLSILPTDDDNNGIPDGVDLSYLIGDTDFVYFTREDRNSPWVYVPFSEEVVTEWENDEDGLWKRERGVEDINFLWLHRTPRYHLIDPAASNIIDTFIITRGYYSRIRSWLNGKLDAEPARPTPFDLKASYSYLIESKMISDTMLLQPGIIKPIIGSKAQRELQATLKVIKSENTVTSDNKIKNQIVEVVNKFFDINFWSFGQPFYFTELSAAIHNSLGFNIESVVLVPKAADSFFGDLHEIIPREDEILQASISVDDIEIVQNLDSRTLVQRL